MGLIVKGLTFSVVNRRKGSLHMDMKQLTTFVTLVRTLNYQKAADELQYAPSTLFKHIQLLEQELGTELFCKAGRQLKLTAGGEAFTEHAENILESYRKAIRSISSGDEAERSLTIGGCEINTGNSLLNLFTQFSRKQPDARISMHTSPNAKVPALVKSDLVDLGFYYSTSDKELPGLQTVRMYQEPVYLVAGRENPLAARKALKYEDLQGARFVYPHDSCCFVVELMSILSRRGVELGKATYPGTMHLVAEHVHSENAVTLLPRCAAERCCGALDMVVLDLCEPPIMAWEMMVYKNYESLRAPARALLAHSGEYAQRMLRSQSAADGETDI